MSTFEVVAAATAAVLIVLPILVFYCVKLGAYAWYKGRDIFYREKEKQDE